MKMLNEKLKGFIDSSVKLSNSNLMIVSNKEIIYWNSQYDNNLVFEDLSVDMQEMIAKFENDINSTKEVFIRKREDTIPLTENDLIEYSGQVFIPVWHRNKLSMILVYYRTLGNYIESSTKVMKTTAKFIPRFIEKYG